MAGFTITAGNQFRGRMSWNATFQQMRLETIVGSSGQFSVTPGSPQTVWTSRVGFRDVLYGVQIGTRTYNAQATPYQNSNHGTIFVVSKADYIANEGYYRTNSSYSIVYEDRNNSGTVVSSGTISPSGNYGVVIDQQQIPHSSTVIAPSSLTATPNLCDGTILLNWNSGANATSYNVYRSTDNVNFTLLTNTTGLTYTDTGRVVGNTYYYKVSTLWSNLWEKYSTTITVNYNLNTPTLSSATPIAYNNVQLSFSDSNTCISSIRIERKTGAGAYSQIASLASGSTSYNDTSVAINTNYTYRIRVEYNGGYSSYSVEKSAIINVSLPIAPTIVLISATTATNTYIDFTNNQPVDNPPIDFSGVRSFEIYRRKLSSGGFVLVHTLPTGTTDTNIVETIDDDFEYKVRAINLLGFTESSTLIMPRQITIFSVSRSVPQQLNLSWANSTSNVSNILIYRSVNSGSTYTLLTTLTAGNTAYNNTSLTEDTRYDYRIKYRNGNAYGLISSDVNGLTYLNTPVITSIVQPVTQIPDITITWTDNSLKETGYEIYRRVKNVGTYVLIATTAPNVTSYNDVGLTPFVNYEYYVKAIKIG